MDRKVKEYIFEIECVKYSDEHGIGTLDDDILENCFLIPAKGIRVRYRSFEDIFYPIINSTLVDDKASALLGNFCYRNNRVVFVYRNGKTYVTKGYKIVENLRKAGYKERSLFVPFANGEKIMTPSLAKKWEKIKE